MFFLRKEEEEEKNIILGVEYMDDWQNLAIIFIVIDMANKL